MLPFISRPGLRHATLVLLCLFLVGAPQARKLWSALSPESHDGKVVILVNGKARNYYRGKKSAEQVVRVSGPARLRVISRVPWSSRYKKKDYTISWSIDGGESGQFSHEIRKAVSSQRKTDKKKVSRGRSNEIEVPAGQHLVHLSLDKSPGSVTYLRYHVRIQDPVAKVHHVDLKPLGGPESRMIQAGKSLVEYYPLSSGQELSVELAGPAFLKVISRLDWNQTMTGVQKYTLRVYEDGLAKQSYVLKGRPSKSAEYVNKQDSLPARGEVFYIEVPAGSHRYTLGFQEAGREVNLRFLAPAAALAVKSDSGQ